VQGSTFNASNPTLSATPFVYANLQGALPTSVSGLNG